MSPKLRTMLESGRSVDATLSRTTKVPSAESLLMRAYKETSSNNTYRQIAASVQSQATFAERMEHKLWLRSPTMRYTLDCARKRYRRFFNLRKDHPNQILAPTLDISLVWNTHRLSLASYSLFSTRFAGKMVYPQDDTDKEILDSNLTQTKVLYYKRYEELYDICQCWPCEAIREAIATKDLSSSGKVTEAMKEIKERVDDYRLRELQRRMGPQVPRTGRLQKKMPAGKISKRRK